MVRVLHKTESLKEFPRVIMLLVSLSLGKYSTICLQMNRKRA
jgi:hypothetical protein